MNKKIIVLPLVLIVMTMTVYAGFLSTTIRFNPSGWEDNGSVIRILTNNTVTITGDTELNNLTIGGGFDNGGIDLTTLGDISLFGDILIRGDILTIVDQEINGSFLPTEDNKYNLGSLLKRWKDGFFSNDLIVEGKVGIGTANPPFSLTVIGTLNATNLNGTLDCTMIGGGSDTDFCADATGADTNTQATTEQIYGNFTNTSNIGITLTVNGIEITLNVTNDLCVQLTGSASLCDGADNTGGAPDTSDYWHRENTTDMLGGSGFNVSLIRLGNTSWAVSAIDSAYPNLDTDSTDDYATSNFLTDYESQAYYKKANLTLDYPNLDTDSTNDLTLEALDNNTIIRKDNATWWENLYFSITSRFGLANYSEEYSTSGYKKANLTLDYPNLDTDSTDDYATSNFNTDIAAYDTLFKIGNMTLAYPNLDTDSTDDLDLPALDNVTIIRKDNTTWVDTFVKTMSFFNTFFNLGNLTNYFGDSDINNSILRSSNKTVVMLNTSNVGNLNITGNFSVDTETFFVDEAINRVGIGTTTPVEKLSVSGNFSVTEVNNTMGNIRFAQFNSSCDGFRTGTAGGWILSCEP